MGDGASSFPQPSERYYIGQKHTVCHMYAVLLMLKFNVSTELFHSLHSRASLVNQVDQHFWVMNRCGSKPALFGMNQHGGVQKLMLD